MKFLRGLLVLLLILSISLSRAQVTDITSSDSIAGHIAKYDDQGGILSWYKPKIPGAGYDHVVRLASEFMKTGVPIEPKTGEKMYFVTCCFHDSNYQDDEADIIAEDWMHNPACVFAGAVISLAQGYRAYTGDDSYLDLVQEMLDYQLINGTTPADWLWADVPYASSDPFETIYKGAVRWEEDGMRGDGLHGIEPDKIGELGYAYLIFYEITGKRKYLEAAIHCADALATHVRDIPGDLEFFTGAEIIKSPWPFRINAKTGEVISEYTSNVVDPIKLLDELIRIQDRIELEARQVDAFKKARDIAWRWLYSKSGPMKTSIWNGYFEDIPNDPDRSNRVQITPMELAKYLIRKPDLDPDININVPSLIHWVSSVFCTEDMDAIKEQTWCYAPMGSHTARYASVCAMWYERTGEEWYREQAYRFFNLATYMTDNTGVVRVGPQWPGSWFSDGYSDYIRHFMDGLGAIPEWAPAGEDHLLKSTSIIKTIEYNGNRIDYTTFDDHSAEVLRITGKPARVTVNGKDLPESKKGNKNGWSWKSLDNGGILTINHTLGNSISILK
jgi:hypothetical protein